MTAGVGVVLLALAAIAITGSVNAQRSVDRLEHTGDLVEAYLDLTRAVAVQDAIEDDYPDPARRAAHQRFDRASGEIAEALEIIVRSGDRRDRALGNRIREFQTLYTADLHRYFTAVDAGNESDAERYEAAADPSSQALQNLVSKGGPAQASRSLREIGKLRRSQRDRMQFTVISLLLGLGAVIAMWLVLRRLRHRIDDAVGVELQRLERAATTDSLTGIHNHRAFDEAIDQALAHAQRSQEALSVLMIDLDGLKAINDRDGHSAGDHAIRATADALAEAARASDGVFRIGGDEFAALLPGASARDALHFAERVHDLLRRGTSTVAVSVGIAEAHENSTRGDLVDKADIALAEAKSRGYDTVAFEAGMTRPNTRRAGSIAPGD